MTADDDELRTQDHAQGASDAGGSIQIATSAEDGSVPAATDQSGPSAGLNWLNPLAETDHRALVTVPLKGADPAATAQTIDLQVGSNRPEEIATFATTQVGPQGRASATVREGPGSTATGPNANFIGRFRIERQLGSGAFGHVYLAHDPHLDRPVAIKVAKAGIWAGDDDRARFLREARAAAQLRHPHICPVYEFGQAGTADYIAYQYVRGTTLRSILGKCRKLPIDSAVTLMVKIADALHYAHTKKIVHRDVKPENILMDEEGEPHVADFGCARREESSGLLTVEGQVMGTPAYMSPEQAAGRSSQADGRSDVWSLGVMLEEMLTGERPFKGTLTEILVSIREHEPKPLRQRDANVPRDLETICQKCLAKNPDERFATAGLLVEELQRFQRGEPIISRPIGVLARTWRWAKRNQAVASLIAGIVFVALLGATVAGVGWGRAIVEQRWRILDQVAALESTDAGNVSLLLEQLRGASHPRLVASELTRRWRSAEPVAAGEWPLKKARTGLGLLATAPATPEAEEACHWLHERLLEAPVAEFKAIRQRLEPFADEFAAPLWKVLENWNETPDRQLRAAAALAAYQPQAEKWGRLADDTADNLLAQSLQELPQWLALFQPIGTRLREPLLKQYPASANGATTASALVSLFPNETDLLVRLWETARPTQKSILYQGLLNKPNRAVEMMRSRLAMLSKSVPETFDAQDEQDLARRANLIVGLLVLGDEEPFWRAMSELEEPSLRTLLIERLMPLGTDPRRLQKLIEQRVIASSTDSTQAPALAGAVLAFGNYDLQTASSGGRESLVATIRAVQRQVALDPGVLSAADWLLGHWGVSPNSSPSRSDTTVDSSPGLTVTPRQTPHPEGHRLVAFGPVPEFTRGSDPSERDRFNLPEIAEFTLGERQQLVEIPRRFEVATMEVTTGQFLRFHAARRDLLRREIASLQKISDPSEEDQAKLDGLETAVEVFERDRTRWHYGEDQPIQSIRWWDAAAYCRWLSESAGMPLDQMCYPSVVDIARHVVRSADISSPTNPLARGGYRLPTMHEWEYVSRAGSTTPWYFGNLTFCADQYAYSSAGRSREEPQAVGLLKPNPFGLFDVLGNVAEMCHNWSTWDAQDPPRVVDKDGGEQTVVDKEIRGGSCQDILRDLRVARRNGFHPGKFHVSTSVGFRIARTVPSK